MRENVANLKKRCEYDKSIFYLLLIESQESKVGQQKRKKIPFPQACFPHCLMIKGAKMFLFCLIEINPLFGCVCVTATEKK
jgi:hypothetical protein